MSTQRTRRQFLKHGLTGIGVLGFPMIVPSSVLSRSRRTPPNDKITVGIIGMGDKGFYWKKAAMVKLIVLFDNCRILGICDVNRPRMEEAKAYVDNHYGNHDCRGYTDFREMLQQDDLDAIVITTPHHWHSIPMIMACEQGKDVYVEKPMSQSIREARAMVQAARRYDRVVQVGTQARSSQKFAYACNIIQQGQIGKVKEIQIGCDNPPCWCDLPAQPVPEGLNWDMWVGPAEWRPYHIELYENAGDYIGFGGGGITDWGQHFFDIAQWALQMDDSGPLTVYPPGEKGEFLTFEYAGGHKMVLLMRDNKRLFDGTRFVGTEGVIDTMTWTDFVDFKPRRLGAKFYAQAQSKAGMSEDLCNAHFQNFLDCMHTRQSPNADPETGCRSVTVAHLANICLRLKRTLHWDPVHERFVNDDLANRFMEIPMREPWHV